MSQRELVRLERVGNRHVIRFTQSNLAKRSTAQDATEQISQLLTTNFGADVAEEKAAKQEAVTADCDRCIEIDFADIQSICSATLSGLVQVHRDARDLEVSLELVNMVDAVRDIFALTRLDRLFTLPKTEMV